MALENMNYEIVVFSDEWFGLPFSCKHLLKYFLSDHTILWFETIGLRSPKLNLYDVKRVIQKISGWVSARPTNSYVIPKNLHIFDPIQIPYNHIKRVRELNKKLLLCAVKEFQHKSIEKERVLITTWPFLGDLIGYFGEQLSVYYRVDDFSEYPGVHKDAIKKLENDLIRKVDMVVATAGHLEQIENKGKAIHFLPHGVDFEHFAGRQDCNTGDGLPTQKIPSPRIGFFGLLSSWIDFDLIVKVASTQPQWSFVFIGPLQVPKSSLPKAPNIYFLGPISYDELPQHARYFDVGLIPFKVNELTSSVNPLKLMEYLAMGIPVVSTPLVEVVKYKEYVRIASGAEDFEKAIQAAIDEDNPELRKTRQLIAKAHGWAEKSEQLKVWIDEALERKLALPR